jgi:flagellar biosynthesis/type III secretory pathway M-ring protein FliF/YscJ
VTVEAVPFLVAEEPKVAPPPAMKLPYGLENPKKYGPIAGGLLALLVLALWLKVRSSRKKHAVSQALALAAAKEKASAEQVTVEILGKDKEEDGDATSPDMLKQMVRERAQLDPATAALIVRGWLGNVEATREEAA